MLLYGERAWIYAKGSRVNMVESQKSEHLGTQSVSLGLYYYVLI